MYVGPNNLRAFMAFKTKLRHTKLVKNRRLTRAVEMSSGVEF